MSAIHPAVPGRLTRIAQGGVGSPRVSGDGRVAVWNQMVDGNLEILRYEDGRVDRVTRNPAPDMHADLSYDGKVIAWTRQNAAGNWDVIQWRDGVESPVATGPGNEMSAAVSRDGKVIAFDDDRDGSWRSFDVRAWQNGELQDVTRGPGSNEFPFLSGDGRRIFWRHYEGSDNADLWMRDQKGVVKPVIVDDKNQVTPSVSPDGTLLLWAEQGEDGEADLVLYDESHGRTTSVSNQKGVDETWARMSADASQIVWTNFDRRKGDPADVQIYLKDGEQALPLTVDSRGLPSFPSISDDGRVIVWMWQDAQDSSQRAIYRFERDA